MCCVYESSEKESSGLAFVDDVEKREEIAKCLWRCHRYFCEYRILQPCHLSRPKPTSEECDHCAVDEITATEPSDIYFVRIEYVCEWPFGLRKGEGLFEK